MHAPPIYFNFRRNIPSSIIKQQVCVPTAVPGTFYSVHNWNAGEKVFGGYAGFQMLVNGTRTVHFSLWSAHFNHAEFRPLVAIDGGIVDVFTNEDTGRKFVAPFNFIDGRWYEFELSITHPDYENTLVRFILTDMLTLEVFHIVDMNYPAPNCMFLHSYGSFLEDFANTLHLPREMRIRGGSLGVGSENQTVPWDRLELSFNEAGLQNLNGGIMEDYFFMQSGGNTHRNVENYTSFSLQR